MPGFFGFLLMILVLDTLISRFCEELLDFAF